MKHLVESILCEAKRYRNKGYDSRAISAENWANNCEKRIAEIQKVINML